MKYYLLLSEDWHGSSVCPYPSEIFTYDYYISKPCVPCFPHDLCVDPHDQIIREDRFRMCAQHPTLGITGLDVSVGTGK